MIDFPWKNNERGVSCVLEGKYFLKKRYRTKFKWHIEFKNIANRSSILFYPANNAMLEINGCISTVTKLSGAGLVLVEWMKRMKFDNILKQV